MLNTLKKYTYNILLVPISIISLFISIPLSILFIPYSILYIYDFSKINNIFHKILAIIGGTLFFNYIIFFSIFDLLEYKLYNLLKYT